MSHSAYTESGSTSIEDVDALQHKATVASKVDLESMDQSPNKKHKLFVYIVIATALLLLSGIATLLYQKHTQKYFTPGGKPLSRAVLEEAESNVRASKPAPTTAALQYAYVATAYSEGLQIGGQAEALSASHQVLNMLYPSATTTIDKNVEKLYKTYHVKKMFNNNQTTKLASLVAKYKTRYQSDGHDLVWDKVIPAGNGYWVNKKTMDPFTPRAGEWKRWAVNQAISVPPPPAYGSATDLVELANVVRASANRTGEDVNIINFWGGVPGTDSPGGIWQNQLYKTVQPKLQADPKNVDTAYASTQMYLARAVSDAFMECWKVKFMYWTARPDMRDPSIVTAMPDPNFPGYVSGHSTISKAAADVLSIVVPDYSKKWQEMAIEARESRLKAGIHFDIDNKIGFEVGTAVAKQTIANDSVTRKL